MPRKLSPHSQAVRDLLQGEALVLELSPEEVSSLRVSISSVISPVLNSEYRTRYNRQTRELLVACVTHPQGWAHPELHRKPVLDHEARQAQTEAGGTPTPSDQEQSRPEAIRRVLDTSDDYGKAAIELMRRRIGVPGTAGRPPSEETHKMRELRTGDSVTFENLKPGDVPRLRVILGNVVAARNGAKYRTRTANGGESLTITCIQHPKSP